MKWIKAILVSQESPEQIIVNFSSFGRLRPVLFRKQSVVDSRTFTKTIYEPDFEALAEETGLVKITKETSRYVFLSGSTANYQLEVEVEIEGSLETFSNRKK